MDGGVGASPDESTGPLAGTVMAVTFVNYRGFDTNALVLKSANYLPQEAKGRSIIRRSGRSSFTNTSGSPRGGTP